MSERPVLDKNLDSKTFRDFYYLKEELVNFCRRIRKGLCSMPSGDIVMVSSKR